MDYKTHGVCSSMIHVELDGDKIKDVDFVGGCNGNLQGISSLVKGMKVEDAIERLSGIKMSGISLEIFWFFHFEDLKKSSLEFLPL